MNIKQYKKDYEDKITEEVKKIVNERIQVKSFYDMENNAITVYIVDDNVEENVRKSIVVYSCIYDVEKDSLTTTGFKRSYAYDGFGVSMVFTDPVLIEETFISGIKGAISQAATADESDSE